jgi:hypothetical protein
VFAAAAPELAKPVVHEMPPPGSWVRGNREVVLPSEAPTLASEPITFSFPDEGRKRWYVLGAAAAVIACVLAVILWPTGQESAHAGGEGSLIVEPDEMVRNMAEAEEEPAGEPTFSAPSAPLEEEDGQPGEAASTSEKVNAPAPAAPAPAAAAPAPKQGGMRFRLPIEGSIEGATHYHLADPAAFAVNLPNARPANGYGDDKKGRDGVRLIWVRERKGGTHWRVFFKGEAPQCKAELKKGVAEILCE